MIIEIKEKLIWQKEKVFFLVKKFGQPLIFNLLELY